jgi:hypothetical protein
MTADGTGPVGDDDDDGIAGMVGEMRVAASAEGRAEVLAEAKNALETAVDVARSNLSMAEEHNGTGDSETWFPAGVLAGLESALAWVSRAGRG